MQKKGRKETTSTTLEHPNRFPSPLNLTQCFHLVRVERGWVGPMDRNACVVAIKRRKSEFRQIVIG
jgi:hypothetical protein